MAISDDGEMEDILSRLFGAQERILKVFGEEVESLLAELRRNAVNREAFQRFAAGIGIDPSRIPNPGVQGSGLNSYQLLGLEKTATDEEVKKRYRLMLFKFHPDTSGTEGTGYICQLITDAYKHIARERGWQ